MLMYMMGYDIAPSTTPEDSTNYSPRYEKILAKLKTASPNGFGEIQPLSQEWIQNAWRNGSLGYIN